MPSLQVDDSYLGQSFDLLAVGGGQKIRCRVVADPPAPTWAEVLLSGAESGGTNPIISEGDRIDFAVADPVPPFGPIPVGYVGLSGFGDLDLVTLDSAAPLDVRVLAGNATSPGPGGAVTVAPGAGSAPGVGGRVTLFSAAVGGAVHTGDAGLAFFTGAEAQTPVVVGARGGNVALAAILTALHNMGLIRDNTTP
jgi:hypothetical protein